MTNSKTTNHKEALVAETDIPATPKDACIFLSDYAAWLLGCGATCIRIEKNVKRMADRWNMTSEMTILPIAYTHDGVERRPAATRTAIS